MRALLFLLVTASFVFAGPRGTLSPRAVTATTAYATTSGATDKAKISRFASHTMDWMLWDRLVAWMLPSSQNAGTGTTAYSFGGLGTYNGTLVNGPTWGADGVGFDSTAGQMISTLYVALNAASVDGTVICYHAPSPRVGADRSTLVSMWDANWYGWAFQCSPTVLQYFHPNVGAIDISNTLDDTFRLSGFIRTGPNVQLANRENLGSVTAVPAYTSSTSKMIIGGVGADVIGAGSRNYKGKIALVAIFEQSVSTSRYGEIASLYKSTLGQGLGL